MTPFVTEVVVHYCRHFLHNCYSIFIFYVETPHFN